MLAFAIALVNCGNDTHTPALSSQFAFIQQAAPTGTHMSAAQRHFQMEHQAFQRSPRLRQGLGIKPWVAGIQNGTDSIVLMNNDGSGQTTLLSQAGWFEAVQESVDGKKGVALAEDSNHHYQVFYGDLTDKNNPVGTQLTSDTENRWSPQLSFDGKQVIFVKYVTNGETGTGLATIMSTAGGTETVISTSFWVSTPSFTPDGKILFEQEDNDTINIMNADGTGNKALTGDANHTYYDEFPSMSPDGKTIVFARYPADSTYKEDIWKMNADGTNATQLTTDGMSWDPMFVNGKIVFISWRDSTSGEIQQVYSMNLDGSNQKRLSTTTAQEYFDNWNW